MARNDGIDRTSVRNLAVSDKAVGNTQQHNEREKDSYRNPDIIPQRAAWNVHFKKPTASYTDLFAQLEAAGTISTRGLKPDATHYCELVFDVNSAYFDNHGGYEFAKQFYEDAYKASVQIVGGEQYILSAVMHADEINRAMTEALGREVYHYHLHVVYVPVVEKQILVANTHHHYDHAYGNAQFARCYCHQDEEFSMRRTMNPHIWDYLFDENGKNIYTEFDRNDIIPYQEYELIPIPTGYRFDLGKGYEVEAIPLRGHSAGQCAYLDHHNHIIFTGDIGGAGRRYEGDPCADNCTVETLWRDMQVVVSRLDEIEAMFPGHGMLDVTSSLLRYELDTLDRIMKDPENADSIRTIVRNGQEQVQYAMNIHQGTAVKYNLTNVFRKTPYRR